MSAYNKKELLTALRSHRPVDANEDAMRLRAVDFLCVCDEEGKNAFSRETLAGHITASAFVVDGTGTECLLVHHAKLDKWMQPGGHCDGSEDVLAAAIREVEEETGLSGFSAQRQIFDVDAHSIPARGSEPAHVHYDIRFLMRTGASKEIAVSDESHDVRWVKLADVAGLTGEESVLRMVRKAQRRARTAA